MGLISDSCGAAGAREQSPLELDYLGPAEDRSLAIDAPRGPSSASLHWALKRRAKGKQAASERLV